MALIRFRPFSQALDTSRDLTDILMGRAWTPAVDVYETKSEVVVSAELPGISERDIHLSITGDLLTIQGERHGNDEVKDGNHYRRERWFGKFERTLALPIPVETGQVKATCRDGVLTVKLPKVGEIKPKEIKIDVA